MTFSVQKSNLKICQKGRVSSPWTCLFIEHASFATCKVLLLQWADMPSLTFDCIELFAGVGNVSAAFRQHGKSVASFDQSYSGSMDFTSPAGFMPGAQVM